jgi:hypothetical protein
LVFDNALIHFFALLMVFCFHTILDLGEEVLSNLIYKYIFDRLEYTQEYHLFGLFTCTRCNKKVDYVNDGDICHECEYPSSSDEYEE